jgi:hypothetical protein
MTQVNGAIYLSLVCPIGGRVEATVNSPRIHDLFITLCTALVTNPGDNLHLTLAKKTLELIALTKPEKCLQGLDFKIGLISLPFKVPLHPKNLPVILASNEGDLGQLGRQSTQPQR